VYISEETIERTGKCPKCGGRIVIHEAREPQQYGDIWVVSYCESCDYHFTGFKHVKKGYKP